MQLRKNLIPGSSFPSIPATTFIIPKDVAFDNHNVLDDHDDDGTNLPGSMPPSRPSSRPSSMERERDRTRARPSKDYKPDPGTSPSTKSITPIITSSTISLIRNS